MGKYSNSGTLGRNDRQREGGNDPGYSGQCEIDGVGYWISAWVKDGKDGKKFFSLSFKPKDKTQKPQQQKPKPAAENHDDETPF